MKTLQALVLVVLAGTGSAAAQTVTLEFQNGRVRLTTQNASVGQILAEWARRGGTTIVNGERVPGPPVTLELNDVPEQQALDVVLRTASGYLVAARENAEASTSSFDRIFILPTSSRPTTSSALPPPVSAPRQAQDDVDGDDDVPGQAPPGFRAPPQNPGARLPPGAANRPVPPPDGRVVGGVVRPPVDEVEPDEPDDRPAPAPSNPFGVAPGTDRPGVITPGPTSTRPRDP